MKQIIITMELGEIEAKAVWDGDSENPSIAFVGRLQIDPDIHSDLMTAEQISGFLDSVVWPQLQRFARELETEAIEKADLEKEIENGKAPGVSETP